MTDVASAERIRARNVNEQAWHYLCLGEDLAGDLCHATVDFAGGSITVQNFRGQHVAFINVCSHRCIQMRPPGIGCGPLRCPYHGWMYDAAGVPVRIPDNRLFYGIDRAEREKLRLAPAAVEACGDLVFVAVSAAPPLNECLGEDFSRLATIRLQKSWIVDSRRDRHTAATNWPDGFSIVQYGEWALIRSSIRLDDGSRDMTATLLHPDRPPPAAAPASLRGLLTSLPDEPGHLSSHR